MDNKLIIEFLCRAKKNTYAGYGTESASSRPKSHDFIYEEENLKYIDSYLGGERFCGEEAVFIDDTPFWAMNYSGRILKDGFNGDFLKEALREVSSDLPFRGPCYYLNNNYIYVCMVQGDFNWFYGNEEIYYKGNKVYECIFHGEILK